MELYLEHPAYLWILPAALPLLIWAAIKSYAIAPRWKRLTSFAVRLVAISLVILAVCRPILRTSRPDQTVVFAVDVSDSLPRPAIEQAMKHVANATRELEAHQRAALVLFGRSAKVVRPLTGDPITDTLAVPGELFGREPAVENAGTGVPDGMCIGDALYHRDGKEQAKARIMEIERNLSSDGAEQRLRDTNRRLTEIQHFESKLGTEDTDIREAIRLARSLLPEDSKRRIVLFSDGNWTRNDPEAEVSFLQRTGITLDARVIWQDKPKEVIVERLVAPGQVKIREPVELELHVSAGEKTAAELKLYRDQFLLKTEGIVLDQGRNLVRIPKQELEEGFHEFLAVVEARDDSTPENNRARAVVVVSGRPKVLLIEGREQDGRYFEQALRDEDIYVEVRPALGFPEELNDLLAYDVLVISDVPATDLHKRQLDMVKRYVKDFGGGLIMLGGEKSFGLGGYYRTAVEDCLPVRMPIKKTIEKPSLGIVLVLDRSGSMGGDKIMLAKEAAIAAAEVLKKKDLLGVVVFDDWPDWVVELQPATNRDEIITQISRIAAGGGTDISVGLRFAYEALRESTAKLKHVIVLSDGHTKQGTRDECLSMVSRMSVEDITLSTVGIGEADQDLLGQMAEIGQGEVYFTNDFGSIPQIFTKETLRASKSMLVEEPFLPERTEVVDQILRGIEFADAPLLMGYVSTTPKESARVLLVSDYGDPILAKWNCGLGRAVAWTSDAKNRWATDWVGWPQFGKFWSQVVRGVMSTGTTHALQQTADIRLDKGEVRFSIDSRDRDGRFLDFVKPEIAIVDAAGNARVLPSVHAAPGLHSTRFPLETYGEFVRLRVKSEIEGAQPILKNYALVESYPPEYRAASADEAFLERTAQDTGGVLDPEPEGAWEFPGDLARGLRDLWRLCVLLAALLLPLDIALRRLG